MTLLTYLGVHCIHTHQSLLPLLKYVRGEVLSQDHWHELFRMLGMPRGTTLEKLSFGDIVAVSTAIISKITLLAHINASLPIAIIPLV